MEFEIITDRRIYRESYEEILYSEGLVVDLGAKNRMNKFLEQYNNKEIKARYVSTDIQFGDLDFVSNVQAVPLANESVDAVICNAVIEHVHEPWTLASEVYRILRPGGVAYVYAPFLYPYHAENTTDETHDGGYDCYRFTIDGLRYLFRPFAKMKISPVEYGVILWWRQVFRHHPKMHWTYRYIERVQDYLEKQKGRPLGVYQSSGYDVWLEKAP